METTSDTPQKHFANRVTPLSKALALILFVVLPILTLYVGYQAGIKHNVSDSEAVSEEISSTSNPISTETESPPEEFYVVEKEEYKVSIPKDYSFTNRREEDTLTVDYYANGQADEIVIVINPLSEEFVRIDSVRTLIQNPRDAQAQAAYGNQSTYDLADPSYRYEYVNDRAVLVYAGGIVHEIIGGTQSKPILYNFTSANHPEYLEKIVRSFTVK